MPLTSAEKGSQTRRLKTLLIQALNAEAKTRGLGNPMRYIASLFFEDPMIAVQVLNYILPKLKSIEAKVETINPSRLIIQLPAVVTQKERAALIDSVQTPLLEAMDAQAETVAELLSDDEDEELDHD